MAGCRCLRPCLEAVSCSILSSLLFLLSYFGLLKLSGNIWCREFMKHCLNIKLCTGKHWKDVKSKMARGEGRMPYSPNFSRGALRGSAADVGPVFVLALWRKCSCGGYITARRHLVLSKKMKPTKYFTRSWNPCWIIINHERTVIILSNCLRWFMAPKKWYGGHDPEGHSSGPNTTWLEQIALSRQLADEGSTYDVL